MTKEEIAAINALKRLAKTWPKSLRLLQHCDNAGSLKVVREVDMPKKKDSAVQLARPRTYRRSSFPPLQGRPLLVRVHPALLVDAHLLFRFRRDHRCETCQRFQGHPCPHILPHAARPLPRLDRVAHPGCARMSGNRKVKREGLKLWLEYRVCKAQCHACLECGYFWGPEHESWPGEPATWDTPGNAGTVGRPRPIPQGPRPSASGGEPSS